MPQEELTHLSVYEWARIMGVLPLHVMGVQIPEVDQRCSSGWFRWQWQDAGRISREDVYTAIARAEADIEHALGYRLLPTWEVDEWHPMPRPANRTLYSLNSRDVRGMHIGTEARWGHFVSGGIRSKELVAEDAAIVYANTRPPTNYLNEATVTVPTVALDPGEITVYYPDKAGDEHWQIRPIDVTIAAGMATIKFQREQAVIEDREDVMLMGAELRPSDGMNDAHFLAAVDVYRIYNDPQVQVSMLWEPWGSGCGCGGEGCGDCAYGVQAGCITLTGDPRLSMLRFSPATWNATTQVFDGAPLLNGRAPDLARLYYYAGLRDRTLRTPNVTLAPDWARIIAIYATSLLERDPCACFKGSWDQWRLDLADPDLARRLTDFDMASPFGLRRGALNAWRAVARPGMRVAAWA